MRTYSSLEEFLNDLPALAAEAEEALRCQGRGTFTRPENLHLTLAFLGEVEDPAPVREALAADKNNASALRAYFSKIRLSLFLTRRQVISITKANLLFSNPSTNLSKGVRLSLSHTACLLSATQPESSF